MTEKAMQMAETQTARELVPLKEARGNSIFAYEIEQTRINVIVFFDQPNELNPYAKVIIRPPSKRKYVMGITEANSEKPVSYFTDMLKEAGIYNFTDAFYEKFSLLIARWMKLIMLLMSLARTQVGGSEYLNELANVLGLSASREKEAACIKQLMELLGTYDEFASYA